jgi:hypothetical protein
VAPLFSTAVAKNKAFAIELAAAAFPVAVWLLVSWCERGGSLLPLLVDNNIITR